jgi:hypothetical protein
VRFFAAPGKREEGENEDAKALSSHHFLPFHLPSFVFCNTESG